MSHHKMQVQRGSKKRVNKAFCCTNCRISVSSSVEEVESLRSDRLTTISSLAHYMVQERLDQMIKESKEEHSRKLMEARKRKQKIGESSSSNTSKTRSNRRLVLVVAMEKSSADPRHDFRRSMVEVILANKLREPKDLRYLLNNYISMNSEEYRGVILEAFYQLALEALKSEKQLKHTDIENSISTQLHT